MCYISPRWKSGNITTSPSILRHRDLINVNESNCGSVGCNCVLNPKSENTILLDHHYSVLNFVESGGLKHVTLMSPSWRFFLSSVLCVALFHLISGQSCSEHCKACGGPEKDQCLQCHTGFILHDNLCVDIDECGTDLDLCPDNTYCSNTHGSYECKGQCGLSSTHGSAE
ncbi:uromodulin-like [Carassius auratus]|uniref:Uromodulin-like n=1 Tax=Carassius auratus TaxID=7957 RepID=A0A6P6QCT7_CARAU|nr:uromodulin-like [Carassius auratus]